MVNIKAIWIKIEGFFSNYANISKIVFEADNDLDNFHYHKSILLC